MNKKKPNDEKYEIKSICKYCGCYTLNKNNICITCESKKMSNPEKLTGFDQKK